jgi:hypothetical protein
MNIQKIKVKAALTIIFALSAIVPAQSGGVFAITQSVISMGGPPSTNGVSALDNTIGQPVAGMSAAGGPFAVRGGFWTPVFAPTAAAVSIGGRVRTAQGAGIRNAVVPLTHSDGTSRSTRTGAFGYFKFENVPVGEVYIVGVTTRRYEFNQPTVIRTIFNEVDDLEFIANEL